MTMPFITVLIALKAALVTALEGVTVDGDAITVRHFRHREGREEEWPCVSIRYVSNDPSEQYGRQEDNGGLPEQIMELAVDLVVDLALAVEAEEAGDEDLDPTGFGYHGIIMAAILDHLMPGDGTTSTLGNTTWLIRYDGTANDEGSASPDAARLEERLVLLYRVRADQPTVLLPGS